MRPSVIALLLGLLPAPAGRAAPKAEPGNPRPTVLVIHGADDTETPPAHSQRVYDALRGPKRLILVPGAGPALIVHSGAKATKTGFGKLASGLR